MKIELREGMEIVKVSFAGIIIKQGDEEVILTSTTIQEIIKLNKKLNRGRAAVNDKILEYILSESYGKI